MTQINPATTFNTGMRQKLSDGQRRKVQQLAHRSSRPPTILLPTFTGAALLPHRRHRGPPRLDERPAIRHGCEHWRPWASHAVMNGMPLMVVARNLGHVEGRTVHRRWPGQTDRKRWRRSRDALQGYPAVGRW